MRSLKQFIISHNEIEGKEIKMITRVLKNDLYLRSLDLSGNQISTDAINDIEDCVKENECLFHIDLR